MGIDSLQDLRDVTIVAFTIAGTVLFLLGIISALMAIWAMAAIREMARAITVNLGPALRNLRETMEEVRSTATFISETVVRPVAKTYGIMTVARTFLRLLGQRRR